MLISFHYIFYVTLNLLLDSKCLLMTVIIVHNFPLRRSVIALIYIKCDHYTNEIRTYVYVYVECVVVTAMKMGLSKSIHIQIR